MSLSRNKVYLYGRLGRDPELRYTSNGQAICNLNIATSRSYKKGEEWVEQTQWHKVVVFAKPAEQIGNRCKKGDNIDIEGRMETREWDDKGVKRHTTEVICEDYKFSDGRKADQGGGQSEERQAPAQSSRAHDSDVPF
jgi:single-strand DNA-binding protein